MFDVVERPISLDEACRSVADASAGAVAAFAGVTRGTNHGRKVVKLEYEAYREMAVEQLEAIAERAAQRWEVIKIAVLHRVGEVPLGETSVAIAVSAVHRSEALHACRFMIDELKHVAPIWKKEYFEGGEVWIGSLADCEH